MSRLSRLLPILAVLSSCGPRDLPPTDRPELRPIAGIPVASELAPGGNAPTRDVVGRHHPPVDLAVRKIERHGLSLSVLTFDARRYRLRVLDNEGGPGTGVGLARNAASRLNGVAAINGGFFTPEGQPLGLVIEDGKKYGTLSSSSLGSGLFLQIADHHLPTLSRRGDWASLPPPRQLLQSGPFLLEDGRTVPGLSASRPRERSFLLWDGGAGWALGHSSSTSLAALSRALASQPVPGLTISEALNLDGGTSSDLWVASSVKGGPVSTRRFWNKDVRNYLVLTPARR